MSLYSIVVAPPDAVINEVAAMKLLLKDKIGFYGSCNSLAHITLNLFVGNEETLIRWERYLSHFTLNEKPLSLCFNKTGSFSNGAYFLAPDDASKTELVLLMKRFYAGFPAPAFGKSNQPHISIGRQLDAQQLAIAKDIIKDVAISFVCDKLVIRKFDEERKQYTTYKQFEFKGYTSIGVRP